MIKGISFLRPAGSRAAYDRLASFFSALGFAPGKGWNEEHSHGASFLAPLGNLEFVDGQFPSTADVLVEVTALDAVHQAAATWLRAQGGEAGRRAPLRHRGNSLEVAPLYRRAGAGLRRQLLGLDRSAQGQAGGRRGRPLRRGHEVCHRRRALECGHYRAAA